MIAKPKDSRLEAFCSPQVPEVFHSVCHRHEIFRDDPLDVPAIHSQARDLFERLLHHATTPPGMNSGRILLLKGEAGSGKTHLMRAFRGTVHSSGLGYFGYMQMTSSAASYADYMLAHLIGSLDQPYDGGASGLMRLSHALAENTNAVPAEFLEMLRHSETTFAGPLPKLVNMIADHVVQQPGFTELDLDLVRILLYLQRGDARIKGRALAWLRCEDLSTHDRGLLGDIVTRTRADSSERMFEQLGRAMWTLQRGVLVVCIDQLEDMVHADNAKEGFQRAMSTVCRLADRVPSSIFVISCLEDYYEGLRQHLAAPMRDRIERDPDPMILVSGRTEAEVESLVETRVRHLYQALDVPHYPKDPVYPFRPEWVSRWANLRTRDVLDNCRLVRDRAIATGDVCLPETTSSASAKVAPPSTSAGVDQQVLQLERRWSDFLAAWKSPPPDESPQLARLLADAIQRCGIELESGHRFRATAHDTFIDVQVLGRKQKVIGELLVGVCNAGSQGGGLGREVEAVIKAAGTRVPVLVRSTNYPNNARSKIAKTLGEFVTSGGRRTVIEETDWRSMLAMEAFRQEAAGTAHFETWVAAENPLSRLHGIRQVLDLDHLIPLEDEPVQVAQPVPLVAPQPPASPQAHPQRRNILSPTAMALGQTNDLFSSPLGIEPGALTQHAAFLGGSGSGKTTLALQVIETLLLQGIPAILIDRKGDLCSYAQESAWSTVTRDADHASRRAALRSKLDVRVHTPGNPSGNPLAIPLAPKGLAQLPGFEREQVSTFAAFALGSMLGYKPQGRDKSCMAILGKAISLLAELNREISLDNLLALIGGPDPVLVNSVGLLEPKLFARLGQDLQTLKLTGGPLLASTGPAVDIDALFGRGDHAVPGKTRLSVISTKFLGDNQNILFFVAQLLLELARWSSKNPSSTLQGVILADEADLYLPAAAKPPTKEPMENLLKRARSAGLSVMLATQSPGDLDYKCRDTIRSWFVGRVKEATAINKMKPMLSDCRVNVAAKLPAQGAGAFFLLQDGNASGFQAHRSLVDPQQLSEEEILAVSRGGVTGR